jgi:hypothetical protein
LTIEGLDATGASVGTVEFYLADYRFSNNALDYILEEWAEVDLTASWARRSWPSPSRRPMWAPSA